MRLLFQLALIVVATLIVAVACGGDDETPEPTATPTVSIPTATPFAVESPPTIVVTGAAPTAPAEVTYIVEPGDTLSEIAARFETTVETIMANNGLTDPTLIFVGQELLITATPAEQPASDGSAGDGSASAGGAADLSVYIVQPGDTAWDIARAFGATVEELAEANDVTVDELVQLQPGDELTLPRPR